MNRPAIRAELERRAGHYLKQTHLVVDYYRIRRKLAYPWPLRRLPIPKQEVRGIANYPWGIWLSWEMEERIGTLGWTGHFFRNAAARAAAKRDLAILARWPAYRPHPRPELCAAHLARTLATALTEWPWLGRGLQLKIKSALRRLVDETLPFVEEAHGRFTNAEQILAEPNAHRVVHNIGAIALVSLALAANVAKHPAAKKLNQMTRVAWEAILRLRARGYTEAVAYDGYLLDFVMNWLATLSRHEREQWLDRIVEARYFEQSFLLAAPGNMMQVAELHDVEPRQMPFHVSALAKLFRLRPNPTLGWYLKECRLDWLRADALAALRSSARNPSGIRALQGGALDAHYASVLRTGWRSDDLAVVVNATNSPASHMHSANGSLVIGTRRQWFVTGPGYQQYMPTSEREFTIGSTAHNTPLINGCAQNARGVRRISLGRDGSLLRTKLDLTRCYPVGLKLKSVTRTVWFAKGNLVVVADQVIGRSIKALDYHWHGHGDAAWWTENNRACIHLEGITLWIHSPQVRIEDANVTRLRGSRGPLTLKVRVDGRVPVVWWVFALGEIPPTLQSRGRSITVSGIRFAV